MTNWRAIRFAPLVLPLVACSWSGAPMEGTVLEEGTNKTIPGAIVVVTWEGLASAIVDSQQICVHVESTVTDARGHYRLTSWEKSSTSLPVSNIHSEISSPYKLGYGWPHLRLPEPGFLEKVFLYIEWKWSPKLYIAPFKGTREERLKYLRAMVTGNACNQAGKSERNLYPLYKALYEEAKTQGATEKDLNWFREEAAMTAVAEDRNSEGAQVDLDKRVRKFLQDNLK